MHLKTDTSAQEHFAAVPTISRSRNSFSIAKKHITTIQFDYLYPVYSKMIYPGDTIAITHKALLRLQTQIAPLYDDLYVDFHAWFVPMRLIQTNWARYQFNAQPTGPTQDNSALTSPNIDLTTLGAGGFTSKSLYDYLGYPTKINTSGAPGNTEWFTNYLGRCYNFIWNSDYRDENLQNAVVVDLDEGPDLASDYVLLQPGKRFDKFTSCLTAAQKGTAATIPLGTSATVKVTAGLNKASVLRKSSTDAVVNRAAIVFNTDASGNFDDTLDGQVYWDPNTTLYADLSGASAATLNQLRSSIAIQHLLEADARGGTRDVEAIQHRWGVTVPDFRLQRPEFIGSSTFTFDGHLVPQTSATSGTDYQANLKGFSQALNQWNISHSFVEHGIFMILARARSNMTYQQGIAREWTYKTRYDWYQPEFSNLGEVAVLNREIYMDGSANDTTTFGYQEYAYELRYDDNIVTGEMRSNYATPLDSRHMAYTFGSLPTLATAFIKSSTPISRNIAVSSATADPIQLNNFFQGKIARTLPMYSIPGLTRI